MMISSEPDENLHVDILTMGLSELIKTISRDHSTTPSLLVIVVVDAPHGHANDVDTYQT
jgi:hypothetical protein